jgi:hypothetical protein
LNLKKEKKEKIIKMKKEKVKGCFGRDFLRRMRAAVVLLALATFVVCSEANVKAEGKFMPWSLLEL